jgi:hypothetical protein
MFSGNRVPLCGILKRIPTLLEEGSVILKGYFGSDELMV